MVAMYLPLAGILLFTTPPQMEKMVAVPGWLIGNSRWIVICHDIYDMPRCIG
jgi:hypothetical protein